MKRLRSIIIVSVGLLALVAQVGLLALATGSQKSAHASAAQDVFTRQDVFARSPSNTLIHRHSTAPNVWTDWETMQTSTSVDSSPSVVTMSATLDIYGAYRNGQDIWLFTYSPRTGQFGVSNLGHTCRKPFTIPEGFCENPSFTSAPAIVSTQPGYLDVFALDVGGSLFHDWLVPGDGWSDWEDLHGPFTDDPAAVSWGPGRIDVFVHNPGDNQLEDVIFDGGSWHAPQPLGGTLTSSPAAFALGVGNIRVAVRDPSNTISSYFMFHGTWASSWTSYNDGPTSAAPAITISAADIQGADDLFEPDMSGVLHLFTVSNVGTTLASLNLGGTPIVGAAAATNALESTVIQPVGSTPTPPPPPPPPTPTPRPPTPTPTPLPHRCTHSPCPVEN
jgi:hypothetical protein